MKNKKEQPRKIEDALLKEKEGNIPVFARKFTLLKNTLLKESLHEKRNFEVKVYQASVHFREHDYKVISKSLNLF